MLYLLSHSKSPIKIISDASEILVSFAYNVKYEY